MNNTAATQRIPAARTGSEILDQFANTMQATVRSLPDEDLASLYRACKRVTNRNCWFGRAFVSPAVLEFVQEELRERPIRRKQEAAAEQMNDELCSKFGI